jgi:hypothetical protein
LVKLSRPGIYLISIAFNISSANFLLPLRISCIPIAKLLTHNLAIFCVSPKGSSLVAGFCLFLGIDRSPWSDPARSPSPFQPLANGGSTENGFFWRPPVLNSRTDTARPDT